MDRKFSNTHILCGIGLAIAAIFVLWYFFIRDYGTTNINTQIERMNDGGCNCGDDDDNDNDNDDHNPNETTANPESFGNINFY
jgi:hypothetical protein